MIPVKKKGSLRLNYSHCIREWPVMWGIRKSYFHWPLKTHLLLFLATQSMHMKLLVVWTGMSIISPPEKDLITCSNCLGKQDMGLLWRCIWVKKPAWQIKRPAWLSLSCIPVWIIPYPAAMIYWITLLNECPHLEDLGWTLHKNSMKSWGNTHSHHAL